MSHTHYYFARWRVTVVTALLVVLAGQQGQTLNWFINSINGAYPKWLPLRKGSLSFLLRAAFPNSLRKTSRSGVAAVSVHQLINVALTIILPPEERSVSTRNYQPTAFTAITLSLCHSWLFLLLSCRLSLNMHHIKSITHKANIP